MKNLSIIFILLLLTKTVFAQDQDSTYKYWITLGLYFEPDVSFNTSYSFSLGSNFYKVGFQSKGHGLIWGGFGKNEFKFKSFDISIGKRIQTNWFQVSLFSGPSLVIVDKRLLFGNKEKFFTGGLQSDFQVIFRAADEFGIGIGLYSNLNLKKSFTGINLNLTFGNGK